MLDKLSQAGGVTLIAMGIVFTVLIVLMFVIKIQTRVLGSVKEQEKVVDCKKVEVATEVKENIMIKSSRLEDDMQLVAAIMAALSAYTGKDASELKIKSINRTNSSNWTNSAIKSNM